MSLRRRFLTHGREIDRGVLRDWRIVIACNRDCVRHRDAGPRQSVNQTNRTVIIEGRHRRRQLISSKQLLGSLSAIDFAGTTRKNSNMTRLVIAPHRHPIATAPISRDRVPAAVDMRYVAVAQPDEVINHQAKPLIVSGAHDVNSIDHSPTAHEDDRHAFCKIIKSWL